ncbi:MAG: hypothetical protein LBN39_12830 [Planctomycetaceae bacterium]|jgi:type II secretory pathway component GspD/PulD (secretin)|nr:hypothetical protein [Planctomycetaceae bacterium]
MRFFYYTIGCFVLAAVLFSGCSKKAEPVQKQAEQPVQADDTAAGSLAEEKSAGQVPAAKTPEPPAEQIPAVKILEAPKTDTEKPKTVKMETVIVKPESVQTPVQPEPEPAGQVPAAKTPEAPKSNEPVSGESPVNERSPVKQDSPVKQESPVKQGSIRYIPSLPSAASLLGTILILEGEPASLEDGKHSIAVQTADLPPEPPKAVEPAAAASPAAELPEEKPAVQTPAANAVQVPAANTEKKPAEKLRFNFRYTPWKDVIEWFADQAGLSLQADNVPSGSLNLTDSQSYTPTEALDVLNSYLLFKEYTIIRKGKSMFVIYLQDGIPPNLLEPVDAKELDDRGKYEICRCVFKLNRTTPDIIQAEAEKLLGPQGSIVALPKSQQIVITETAGTLRAIRDIIRRIDDPDEVAAGNVNIIEMKNLSADEALGIMRKLLVIDENDTSLRTAVDASGTKIWMSGRADMVEKAKDMIKTIDGSYESKSALLEGQPQFEVYDTGTADPAAVLAVLQTLLAGVPDIRLSLDTKTGGVAALGRPANHATIKETIKQMQLNVPQVEVIPLKRISPASAVENIKKFFATTSASDITATSSSGSKTAAAGLPAPTVEADVSARQIIVRGTVSQIADIRSLLLKLGEDGTAGKVVSGATIRSIPLSPAATALVLDQLKDVWSKVESNELKVVAPSAIVPSRSVNEIQPKVEKPVEKKNNVDELIDKTFEKNSTFRPAARPGAVYHPVKYQAEEEHQPVYQPIQEQPRGQAAQAAETKAPVVVSAGPNGLRISSSDPEALDKLEELIRMLSDETVLGRTSMVVYYLKNSTAEVVVQALNSLLGSGASASTGVSGAGSVDTSSVFEAEHRAEILGMLTPNNSIEKTGTVTISPDSRLNALLIQANPVDHKTIEKLLTILDKADTADDVMIRPKARLIPLQNMRAEDAKATVETAFSARIQSGSGGSSTSPTSSRTGSTGSSRGGFGGGQPPMMMGGGPPGMGGMGGMPPGGPGMMFQQIMSQMNRGGSTTAKEQEAKMTLAVDARSNSLIVTSPESLYLEVREFVETLDEMAVQAETVVEVVNPKNVSTDLVRQTISNLAGDSVKFTTSQASGSSSSRTGSFGGFGSTTGGFGGFGSNRGGFGGFGSGTTPGGATNPFMNIMRGGFGGGTTPGGFGGRTTTGGFGGGTTPGGFSGRGGR